MKNPDFTAFAHPVLAVTCPKCASRPGTKCDIQQRDWASDYHLERKNRAGEVFAEQHGKYAEISRVEGIWIISPAPKTPKFSSHANPAH